MTYTEYKKLYNLSLDKEQDIACAETEGNILLLAVPGSGKTSVLIARLGYLTKGLGVPPRSVLAVTYSVTGAREMQSRYASAFGDCDIEIRTINGFCSKVISLYERVRGTKAPRLLDREGEVTQIIRGIMAETGGYPTENEIKDIKSALTYSRNMLLTKDEISKLIPVEGRDFSDIYERYKVFKRENRLMDYDDQLFYAYKILNTVPEVFWHFAERFKYICVDEAQDTSKIQHLIIRRLADGGSKLFMVGDEDQSIYGFRAAYPDGLIEFDSVYTDAKVLFIEKNYRSTKTIVEAADRFIRLNKRRRNKSMTADREAGEPIKLTELSDLREVPSYIAKQAELEGIGCSGSLAVLCRLNDSLIPIIDYLSNKEIPFSLRLGDGMFFTHYIVSDICNFLNFALDPFDKTLFEQLYYKMCCFIARGDFEYAVLNNAGDGMLSFPEYIEGCPFFKERTRKRIKRVIIGLGKAQAAIRQGKIDGAIRHILELGYSSYLLHRTKDLTKVNTLLAIAERQSSLSDFFKRLAELREIISRGRSAENGIVLSTVHSAKGMEFDRVILADCRNGILPSLTEPENGREFSEQENILREEERRLFYVAVTRAKNRLEILTYKKAMGQDAEGFDFPRQLLGMKPDEKKEKKSEPKLPVEALLKPFTEGTAVYHRLFGEGVIIGRLGYFAEIRFARYPLPKRIALDVCIQNGILREV